MNNHRRSAGVCWSEKKIKIKIQYWYWYQYILKNGTGFKPGLKTSLKKKKKKENCISK
jgi:hypothetical protein